MSSSDVGGNLDASDFEGLAAIATTLETTLKHAERHVQQECDCFKGRKSDDARGTKVACWCWPLTPRPSHHQHTLTQKA